MLMWLQKKKTTNRTKLKILEIFTSSHAMFILKKLLFFLCT